MDAQQTATAARPTTHEGDAEPNGVELIAAERRRQVEKEGWTPEHDESHPRGELAQAGRAYADAAIQVFRTLDWCRDGGRKFAAHYEGEERERMMRDLDEGETDPLGAYYGRRQDGGVRLPLMNEWPWDEASWKPDNDPVRTLVKAGALIAAEIDRELRRAEGSNQS